MNYKYRASETFWKNFYALNDKQKTSVRDCWKIFKVDPFDIRLGTHKINALSNAARRTVYGVVIEKNLRSVFYITQNVVYTFDLGTHEVYKT